MRLQRSGQWFRWSEHFCLAHSWPWILALPLFRLAHFFRLADYTHTQNTHTHRRTHTLTHTRVHVLYTCSNWPCVHRRPHSSCLRHKHILHNSSDLVHTFTLLETRDQRGRRIWYVLSTDSLWKVSSTQPELSTHPEYALRVLRVLWVQYYPKPFVTAVPFRLQHCALLFGTARYYGQLMLSTPAQNCAILCKSVLHNTVQYSLLYNIDQECPKLFDTVQYYCSARNNNLQSRPVQHETITFNLGYC